MHKMEIENITGGLPPHLVNKMQKENSRKMQVDEKLKEFEKAYKAVLLKQKMGEIERLRREVEYRKIA